MSKEAMKLALEALSKSDDFLFDWHENESDNEADAYATARHLNEKAITALREALAEQPAQQEAQAEETVKERTPQERRDAGEWHCPECFTFGHQHRQGCTAAHGIKENT